MRRRNGSGDRRHKMTDCSSATEPRAGCHSEENRAGCCQTLYYLFFLSLYTVPSVRIFRRFQLETQWYKGALHCHTRVSDGDSTPQEVADWHRKHGYDFIVITITTDYRRNDPGLNRDRNFLVIPGEGGKRHVREAGGPHKRHHY